MTAPTGRCSSVRVKIMEIKTDAEMTQIGIKVNHQHTKVLVILEHSHLNMLVVYHEFRSL